MHVHMCVCVYTNHLPLVNDLLCSQHTCSKTKTKNKTPKKPKSNKKNRTPHLAPNPVNSRNGTCAYSSFITKAKEMQQVQN